MIVRRWRAAKAKNSAVLRRLECTKAAAKSLGQLDASQRCKVRLVPRVRNARAGVKGNIGLRYTW